MGNKAMCLIKPDGMEHQLEIKKFLIFNKITIISEIKIKLTNKDVDILYEPLLISNFEAVQLAYKSLSVGEVLLLLCDGTRIFARLKKIKQYLRTIYMKDNPFGIIHTSEHQEEAMRELRYFFNI